MVHVAKCPLLKQNPPLRRGTPTTEFHIDGKPQIYCYGWIDGRTDEPLDCCKNCADWVDGEQCEKDYEEYQQSIHRSQIVHR